MQTKTVCRFARIPRTVCLIALSAVIFTGILVLMVFALALTANGMITLPSAFIRIIGKGSIFVSDLSEYTMLFFGAASLFFGLGLILLSVARICPFAASFVYRLFQRLKNEAERSYPFPPYPCAEADGGTGAYSHIFPVRSDMPYRYAYVCTDNRQGLPQ